MLQLDAEAQAKKAAEGVESHQEAASTNWVELGYSLMDYKAVCMAADASVVGLSCQSNELQAVPLPGHLALWEVSTGDHACCLIALKMRVDIRVLFCVLKTTCTALQLSRTSASSEKATSSYIQFSAFTELHVKPQ